MNLFSFLNLSEEDFHSLTPTFDLPGNLRTLLYEEFDETEMDWELDNAVEEASEAAARKLWARARSGTDE